MNKRKTECGKYGWTPIVQNPLSFDWQTQQRYNWGGAVDYDEPLNAYDVAWVLQDIIDSADDLNPPYIVGVRENVPMRPGGFGMLEIACNKAVQTTSVNSVDGSVVPLTDLFRSLELSNNRDWINTPVTTVVAVEKEHWVAVKVWWHGDRKFTLEVIDSLKDDDYKGTWNKLKRDLTHMHLDVTINFFRTGAQDRAAESDDNIGFNSGGIYAALAAFNILASSDELLEEIDKSHDNDTWSEKTIRTYRNRLAAGRSTVAYMDPIVTMQYGVGLHIRPQVSKVQAQMVKTKHSSKRKTWRAV